YSPVPDATACNGIGGVLATVHEISEQVVGERRMVALRDLGARSAEAKSAEEACRIAAETLSHHSKDVPFALLYLIDQNGKQARLAASAGLSEGASVGDSVIELEPEGGSSGRVAENITPRMWPLAEVVREESLHVVEDLAARFERVPRGPWSDPPSMAVVMPIRSNIARQPAGVLVAGVSSRLRFDDAYAGFFELVSGQIATAIANARAYEEERRRAEALASIDRAKTAFFSNVSHEFRTPLTLMLGPLADLLQPVAGETANGEMPARSETGEEQRALPPGARAELEVVQRNGLRLLKLVNTLLDFARIEAGRVQAVYEPTDLAAYTADLASSFRSLVEKAGMRLVVDCPALPEPVYVDRDMWEKIVLNLLSNAFKFTLRGSITVALHLIPWPDEDQLDGRDKSRPYGDRPGGQNPARSSAARRGKDEGSYRTQGQTGGTSPAPTVGNKGSSAGARAASPVDGTPGRGGARANTPVGDGQEGPAVGARLASPSVDVGMVELEVRDTGTGIPAAELPRLFERFHRVEGVRARTHEGSGIGLALVQELVHLHGGSIRAESVEGGGTTFFVRVPLGSAHLPAQAISAERTQASTALGIAPFVEEAERWMPDTPEGKAPAATATMLPGEGSMPRDASISYPGRPSARIVLADDNADMRAYLRRLLGQQYRVEAVANGQDALEAIRREPPDLVLADVMMPELDGFGLLRALRAQPETINLPVILLSARAGEEAIIEGLQAGADDYLVKPFSAREVLSRVAARLDVAKSQAETLTRAREMEATFDSMVDGVAIYDAEGRILRLNPALLKMLALDEEYTRHTIDDRVPRLLLRDADGEPLPAEHTPPARVARGEIFTGSSSMDMRVRALDGRDVAVNVSGAPVRDLAGRIVGGVCVYRDVTERRALERRTSEALEALLAMAEAMVGTEPSAAQSPEPGDRPRERLVEGQPALAITVERLASLCCRVLDTERVAILGVDPDTELLRPIALTGASSEQERQWRAGILRTRLTDRFGAETCARLRAGESVFIETDHLRVDDPARVLSDRCFLLAPMFAGGTLAGYFGVNFGDRRRNYTAEGIARTEAVARLVGLVVERERLTREREEARAGERAQREATRRMDEFLGIASHEMRTPLTSITANVQMAKRQLRPWARQGQFEAEDESWPHEQAGAERSQVERAHVLLERTERQVARLDRLVGDLLDASRIQADKLELRPERCDLLGIVREAVEGQRATWPRREIELRCPRGEGVTVSADADRIGQVMTNYLTNALKYSPAGTPVSVRVRLEGDATPATPSGREVVRVSVRDHGPGLSAEQRERLFERFYRAPGIELQSGSGVGLGLGLYIAKTIIERHGGRVGVESAPGAGATFWFTLPLALGAI
ncbi:MAG TPA: ATP-binding protein, partial [Ktedonobacterales bacterium]